MFVIFVEIQCIVVHCPAIRRPGPSRSGPGSAAHAIDPKDTAHRSDCGAAAIDFPDFPGRVAEAIGGELAPVRY